MSRDFPPSSESDGRSGATLADGDGSRRGRRSEQLGLVLRGSLHVPVLDLVGLLSEGHDVGLAPIMVTEVDGPSATSVLAAVAALRPGAALGTAIVPLGSRSAAAMAMEATTAAGLAGGEFLLGVGVSSPQIVRGWHGVEHDPSLATTRERLIELRGLLDGAERGSFTLRGESRKQVRVLLGALGPKMQALAYEVADGAIMNLVPPQAITRPPSDRRCLSIVWTACGARNEETARGVVASYAMARPYAAHFERMGYGAAMRAIGLLRESGRWKDAPAIVPDDLLEQLFATPENLAERLQDVRRAGAEPVVLPLPGPGTLPEVLDAVRSLLQRLGKLRSTVEDA
jgi:alkanesulfonate monooxygenase SsuD/methylene tetrahydromethanopterin reductase-like flavin-dependent oxidoreductase (luciferase family)